MLRHRLRHSRSAIVALALGLAVAVPFISSPVTNAQSGGAGSCTWSATSEVIYYAMPEVVGECTGAEQINQQTGLLEQRTTRGTMLRRPGDGLTAFTNGTSMWILGPDGNVMRQEGTVVPATAP